MVKHHVLIGLGFKRQNFRNRALQYMIDKKNVGNSNPMHLAVMPPSYSRPQIGRGPLSVASRIPLKFNY